MNQPGTNRSHSPQAPAPDDPAPHDPAPHDPAPHDPAPHDPAPHDPASHDSWAVIPAVIERVHHESGDVATYDIRIKDDSIAERYNYAPGQFNMLYVPSVGEAAISISGRTQGGRIRHTVRNVGSVTGALARGGVGMSIGLRGPFGTPWPTDPLRNSSAANDLVLVAGGIGIAPLRSVVEFAIDHRDALGKVDVLIGARTPSDLIYAVDYEGWRSHDIGVQTTVDRAESGWTGHVGVVTPLLERMELPNPESTTLMTCGPEVMMRFVVQSAASRGVPESQAWVTMERNMNCAIGLCGHCQMGSEFLCKDGPVFAYDRIAPWFHVQGV